MNGGDQRAPLEPGRPIGLWRGLAAIYSRLSVVRRRNFYLVLALMLLNALAELGTIGAVLPLLALLADPNSLGDHGWALAVFDFLGSTSPLQRQIVATLVFCAFAVIVAVVRLQLVRETQYFGFRLAHELMMAIHRRLLAQPYSFHIHRGTSSLVTAVEKVDILVFSVLLPVMQAAISAFIAAAIIAALVYIDPFTALVAAAAFSTVYVAVSAFARKRLASNSGMIGKSYDERQKILQESLGGIRDVILDHSQSMYVRLFDIENGRLNEARASTVFIASAPRFVIEAIGIVIIAGLALLTAQREGGLSGALPILGAIALGAQRLLPLIQQIYNSWSTAAGHISILAQALELLHLPLDDGHAPARPVKPLPLSDRIAIEQVSFRYPTRSGPALDDVSFEIPAGSSVALIGETGSGKSTLVDLLMGLLQPSDGRIVIDGVSLTPANLRRWQRSIAHVPQSIFLADASIARNIALSRGDGPLDREAIVDAARKAQLDDFIASLPDGYETTVGERGIRLSGGQRQRLGIARAIYKQAPVLILDEATSALDDETERAVIDSLARLGDEGRTIITVAHRKSTIARCDMVVRLQHGRLAGIGTYAEVAPEKPARLARTRDVRD